MNVFHKVLYFGWNIGSFYNLYSLQKMKKNAGLPLAEKKNNRCDEDQRTMNIIYCSSLFS